MDHVHYLEQKLNILKLLHRSQAHINGGAHDRAIDDIHTALMQLLVIVDHHDANIHQFTRGLRYSPNQHPAAGEPIDFWIKQ